MLHFNGHLTESISQWLWWKLKLVFRVITCVCQDFQTQQFLLLTFKDKIEERKERKVETNRNMERQRVEKYLDL